MTRQMSTRPDPATLLDEGLDEGETLLWQGQPKPGRPVPRRAALIAVLLYLATFALFGFAWWLALIKGNLPGVKLAVYGMIGTAAFCTFVGLRLTLLNRRRARARDAATRYAITDRRVLAMAGPYRTEVALDDAVDVRKSGNAVIVTTPGTRLHLDRLDDAAAAYDILQARIGGKQ